MNWTIVRMKDSEGTIGLNHWCKMLFLVAEAQIISVALMCLDFLSHSFSILELRFIFHHVLPDLSGKIVLDVGSRLGAVLYAGYIYSFASKLQGVEINAEFCELQEKIINKYNFSDRIQTTFRAWMIDGE
ncbi:unnamed protein product, partial [Ranitomeya imitator]